MTLEGGKGRQRALGGARRVRILAIVQVEKEAGHVLVVDPAAPVGLVLGDELNTQRVNTPVQSEPQSLTGIVTHWTGVLASPQYSEMNSFFCTGSLIKVPHPATSDGAKSRCWERSKVRRLKIFKRHQIVY